MARCAAASLCAAARIFHILRSRLYLGEIEHKGLVHKGLHVPIITPAQYDAVTDVLATHAETKKAHPARAPSALLIGKLFDPEARADDPKLLLRAGRAALPLLHEPGT
jgi:site-specific DNA recombinase